MVGMLSRCKQTMCQLLGMNCNVPTDIVFSFTGFAMRGGHTDTHHDGWGIAFFEGAGVRHFVDHQAAIAAPVAELIKRYPIKSRNVIAHIRKAAWYGGHVIPLQTDHVPTSRNELQCPHRHCL